MKKIHIARLIESELEQYEVILAARSILDKLQKIAEDLSKIEGNEILPLIDNMNSLFGAEKTSAFSTEATTALRDLVTNTTTAREKIGSAIDVLEGKAPANDMAAGDETAPVAGNDMEAPEAEAGAQQSAAPAAGEEDAGSSIDDILGGAAEEDSGKQENPLGRVRKEGIEHVVANNAKTLKESKNPDKLVYTVFAKLCEDAKHSKSVAIQRVAEAFGIDIDDVKSIVKEHSSVTVVLPKKKVSESEDKPRLRKIANFNNGDKSANVYKDLDWDEFRVRFYTNGKHNEAADYHTSDKDDAINDAKYFCGLNESILKEDVAIKVRFVGNETGLSFEYFDDQKWKTLDTYDIPHNKWKSFCQEWLDKKKEQGINVDVVGFYFDKAPPISEDFGDMFRGIGNMFKSPVKMQQFKLHPKAVRSREDAIARGKQDFDSHKGRTIEVPYLLINDNGRIRTFNSDINNPFIVRINGEQLLADKWEDATTYTPRWKVDVLKKNPKLPPNIKTAWMDAPAYYVISRK